MAYETIEIIPSDARNPYRADIISGSGFDDAVVRVEPPFTPSGRYLELLGSGDGIDFLDCLIGQESTVLSLAQTEFFETTLTDKERVQRTIETLIEELGSIASREKFLERAKNLSFANGG